MSMKKSNMIKFSAAALTFLGISATGVKPVKQPAQAASKRIKVISKQYVTVWANYQKGRHVATHLKKGSSHFVYQTATDSMGNLWYRIGKKEWVMAKYFNQVKSAKKAVKAKKTKAKSKKTVKKARSAASLAASWFAPMGGLRPGLRQSCLWLSSRSARPMSRAPRARMPLTMPVWLPMSTSRQLASIQVPAPKARSRRGSRLIQVLASRKETCSFGVPRINHIM